ncbi:probable serine/threonine-protein kinase DDB_G0283337 [Panonychus citri]|uniref:probable serine/threonine-protein kinase DDB_G0283337 n=1 Tax=Panonychus citri TaxID=50023 RepID=UPI002306FD27|nr:probable serine/threonine-protein kinase DDB_G0283337 [Panonychus citri]
MSIKSTFLITINYIFIYGSLMVNCEVIDKLKSQQLSNRIKRQSNLNSTSIINGILSSSQLINNQEKISRENLITILQSLEINETTIKVNWRLQVINHHNKSSQLKINPVDHYLPTEWTLRVRQFGTLYVKLRFISEIINYSRLLITGFKDINFVISSLQDGIAYELCLQSAEFPVHDKIDTILRRVSIINSQGEPELNNNQGGGGKMVCKEVVTRRSTCGNTLTPGKIATVTVVSSASTIIIVVIVGCCWCPNNKEDEKSDQDGHRSENDEESIEDEDNQPEVNNNNNTNNNQGKWFKLFKSSSTVTTNQLNDNNNQRKPIGRSLIVHNVNYEDKNYYYNVKKVDNWFNFWRKIKFNDQPILFNKHLETINIGFDCQPTSTTIYRPKSWPQDEWTIKVTN